MSRQQYLDCDAASAFTPSATGSKKLIATKVIAGQQGAIT
jgi:hypothetical protein